MVANPIATYMDEDQLAKLIKAKKQRMEEAAQSLNFVEAAKLRDELVALEKSMADKAVERP